MHNTLESKLFAKYDVSQSGTLTREEVANLGNGLLSQETDFQGTMSEADIDLVMRLGGDTCNPEIMPKDLPTALSILYLIKEDQQTAHELFIKFDVDQSKGLPIDQLSNLLTDLNFGIQPRLEDVEYVLRQCGRTGEKDDPITEEELRPALMCWYMLMEERRSKSKKLNIVVVGRTGVGKATLAAAIAKEFKLVHIHPAGKLRRLADRSDEDGLQAMAAVDRGVILPVDLAQPMVLEQLGQPECQDQGWVMTGFPQTVDEARALADAGVKPDVVFLLEATPEVVFERCLGRIYDPEDGAVYHETLRLPESDEALDRCVKREDSEEAVRKRIATFDEHERDLKAFYADVLVKIPCAGKLEEIEHETSSMLHEIAARLAHDSVEHEQPNFLTPSPQKGAAPPRDMTAGQGQGQQEQSTSGNPSTAAAQEDNAAP